MGVALAQLAACKAPRYPLRQPAARQRSQSTKERVMVGSVSVADSGILSPLPFPLPRVSMPPPQEATAEQHPRAQFSHKANAGGLAGAHEKGEFPLRGGFVFLSLSEGKPRRKRKLLQARMSPPLTGL